jgi:hypothetical protein
MASIPVDLADGINVTGSYFVQPPLIGGLRAVGQAWRDTPKVPNSIPNYFTITDGSYRWGGLKPPHLSHRFGGTIDVRPISTDGQPTRVGAANYHRDGTSTLARYFRWSGATEVRFADALPDVTVVDPSHKDHLHVSWLKAPAEPWAIGTIVTNFDQGGLR